MMKTGRRAVEMFLVISTVIASHSGSEGVTAVARNTGES
jgi:hypothetical protein